MKKKLLGMVMAATLSMTMLAGCTGSQEQAAPKSTETEAVSEAAAEETTEAADEEVVEETTSEAALADGKYSAKFTTDGSMFHVNEVYKDRGTLTVKDGQMTIHITLPSKNTVNLFMGSAEDAQKDGAQLLQPTTDTVTYDDGTTEEVNGFDIPVPYLDEEFDVALKGDDVKTSITVEDLYNTVISKL